MKKFIVVSGLLGFAMVGGACKPSTVERLEQLREEMCACTNAACAEAVGAKIKELKNSAEKPADSERERVKAVLDEVQACATKAELGG